MECKVLFLIYILVKVHEIQFDSSHLFGISVSRFYITNWTIFNIRTYSGVMRAESPDHWVECKHKTKLRAKRGATCPDQAQSGASAP